MAVETPGFANQGSTYGAEQTRRAIASLIQRGASIGSVVGGIVSATDCQITPPGSGLSVNIAPGEIWVPGSSAATQSGYYCRVSSTTNLAIAAADPTNPRIDRISALITDSAYSGGTNTFAVSVQTGTPTAGATLVNLNGVVAAPASSYTLGYCLTPATAVNTVAADISNVAALVIDSLPSYAYVNGSGATTAVSGQWIEAAAGVTVTLPASPVKGSTVAVTAGAGVSGASQVTVAAGTSGSINGVGLTSAANFKLGTPGASVILEADGSNWWIVSGQQDSGWVALTLGTNISAATTYTPSARLQGDTVRLKGGLLNGTGASDSGTLATVPSGLRPSAAIYPLVPILNAIPPTSYSFANMTITSAGTISIPAGIAAGSWLDLTGLTYSLN